MSTYLAYQSKGKKNPTPEQLMHDIKLIAKNFGVYFKGADVYSDYFWEKVQLVRKQSYWYSMRLEQLAFRHERAKIIAARKQKQAA